MAIATISKEQAKEEYEKYCNAEIKIKDYLAQFDNYNKQEPCNCGEEELGDTELVTIITDDDYPNSVMFCLKCGGWVEL